MGTEVESPNSNNRVSQIITDSFLFLDGEEDDGHVNGNSAPVLPSSPVHLQTPPPDSIPSTKYFISPNGNSSIGNGEGEGSSSLPRSDEDGGRTEDAPIELRTRSPDNCVNSSEIKDGGDMPSDSGDSNTPTAGQGTGKSPDSEVSADVGSISVSERISKLERIKSSGNSCKFSGRVLDGKRTNENYIEDPCDTTVKDTHVVANDSVPTRQDEVAENGSGADNETKAKGLVDSETKLEGTKKLNLDSSENKVKRNACKFEGQCELPPELYEARIHEHARFIVSKVLNFNSLREAFKRSSHLRKIKKQSKRKDNIAIVNSDASRPKNLDIFENCDESDGRNRSSSDEVFTVDEPVPQKSTSMKSPIKPKVKHQSEGQQVASATQSSNSHQDKSESVPDQPRTTVVLRRKKSSVKKSSEASHEGGSASCDSENSSPCQSPATRRRHALRSPVLRLKQEWNSVDMGSDLDSPRQSEDSEDDDDAGIYAESYRNSQWLYLGDVSSATSTDTLDVDTDVSRTSSNSASSGFETTTDTSLGEIDIIVNDNDDAELVQSTTKDNLNISVDSGLGQIDVASPKLYKQRVQYDDLPPTLPRRTKHVRSESISTTASEIEFRKRYQAKTRRIVQRKSSTQTYQRMSERFYDDERCMVIEKRDGDLTFGFHIKSCRPVMVSTVEAGSAAEAAGVRVGDSVIAVNDVNILEVSHEEAIRLISQNTQKVKLTVAADNKLTSDMPLCMGFLNKQGGSGILKNWRRRWFILKQDHCLYYYKTEEDKDPLGAILLTNYTISKALEANRKYTFKAHKYGQRTYYFQADTEDEMNCWASALSNAAKTTTKTDTWLDVSSHNVGLPALSIKSPDCHGHLTKMGNRRKNWKRRYCVLKDACLYYYIDLTSSTAQGVAHLHGYKVEEGLPYNKKLGFTLQPPDPSMRTFYFFADNETDMRRWINALQKSIGKWVRADD